TINPKYGHQYVEWNCVRWLLFSNHPDALPMPREDRRFAVVRNPSERKPQSYYDRIYPLVNEPAFIEAVGWWLNRRDLSQFNPGEQPAMNAAKQAVIEATTPQLDRDLAVVLRE